MLLNLKKTFEKISKVYTHCTETYFSEVIRKREKKKESNEDENIRTEQKQRTIKINFRPRNSKVESRYASIMMEFIVIPYGESCLGSQPYLRKRVHIQGVSPLARDRHSPLHNLTTLPWKPIRKYKQIYIRVYVYIRIYIYILFFFVLPKTT